MDYWNISVPREHLFLILSQLYQEQSLLKGVSFWKWQKLYLPLNVSSTSPSNGGEGSPASTISSKTTVIGIQKRTALDVHNTANVVSNS